MSDYQVMLKYYCEQINSCVWHLVEHDPDDDTYRGPPFKPFWVPVGDDLPHDLMSRRRFHDEYIRSCPICFPPEPKTLKSKKPKPDYYRYLLTIQWNRKKCNEATWRSACDSLLKSKKFKHGVYVYERGAKGTNPHCHLLAFCKSKLAHNAKKNNLPRSQYKGHFEKFEYTYGHIDFKKVKDDNGIEAYMSKERETEKQYFSNTTESVHPLQPWLSPPDASSPSVPASDESDPPSSDEE